VVVYHIVGLKKVVVVGKNNLLGAISFRVAVLTSADVHRLSSPLLFAFGYFPRHTQIMTYHLASNRQKGNCETKGTAHKTHHGGRRTREPFFRFANLRLQMGGKVPRTQKNIKDAKPSETPHTTSPHHLPTRTPPLAPPLFTASTPPPCVRPGWYAARSNPNRAGQDAEGLVGTIRTAL